MERRNGFGKSAVEQSDGDKCFQMGSAREVWRETMLDVRLDEEAFALPYAHLNFIKCSDSAALILSFTSHLVKIQGRRLRPLYEALRDHTVRFVAATEASPHDEVPSSETVITSIDLVPVGQADGGML